MSFPKGLCLQMLVLPPALGKGAVTSCAPYTVYTQVRVPNFIFSEVYAFSWLPNAFFGTQFLVFYCVIAKSGLKNRQF